MNQLPSKAEFMAKLSKTRATTRERRRIGVGYNFSLKHHLHSPARATGEHYFWHIYRGATAMVDDFARHGIWDSKCLEIMLMHDSIEDARESGFDPALVRRRIAKAFGDEVAYWTMAITKRPGEHSQDRLKVLPDEPEWRPLFVKIYDRGDNLHTLHGMKRESQRRKLAETEKYFPAIFERLEVEFEFLVKAKKMSPEWLHLLQRLRKKQIGLIAANKLRLRGNS